MVDVVNRLTGKVENLTDEEAAIALVDGGGTSEYATPEEVARARSLEQFGSTGQQAIGALELGARTATFGLLDGFGSEADIRGREQVLKNESPGVAFAAQAAGSLVPGMGAAGLAGRGLMAAGAGARAVGLGTAVAEGLAVGSAEEIEQARYEGRDVSVGNILLYGVGGELAGRAIPAALRRGGSAIFSRGERSAASAIVGDTAENALARAEQRSLARASEDVARMPAGPERDALLTRTADTQYDKAAKNVRQSLDNIEDRWANMDDVPDATFKKMVAPDAPVQMRWGTETAQELSTLSDSVGSVRLKESLGNASQALLDAEKGLDIFVAARTARKELSQLPQSIERDAAIESLKKGTQRVDLFGKAAEFESDMARTGDAFMLANSKVRQAMASGDSFDPSKIRTILKKDPIGRGLTEESLMRQLDAIEDRIQVHTKWNTAGVSGLDSLKKDVVQAREGFKIANDIQSAQAKTKLETKPTVEKSVTDQVLGNAGGMGAEMAETAVDMGLAAVGLPPVAGIAMRLLRGVNANGRAAIGNVARQVVKPVVSESWSPVRTATAATALTRFQGEYPGYRESYEAKKETLLAVNSNPELLADAMAESFGSLPAENPELFMKLTARLGQAYAYVTDNLPSSVSTSMLYPRGVPPSQSSLREFAILWNSVMEPESVLDDVAEGTATPAQIKALAAVHPDIHEQLKNDIINEVSTNFGEMSSQTKVWLDILFDADGLAGPSFSSSAARYIQDSLQQAKQAGGQGQAAAPQLQGASSPAAGLQAIKGSVTNRGSV